MPDIKVTMPTSTMPNSRSSNADKRQTVLESVEISPWVARAVTGKSGLFLLKIVGRKYTKKRKTNIYRGQGQTSTKPSCSIDIRLLDFHDHFPNCLLVPTSLGVIEHQLYRRGISFCAA
jgi:hypothetical protein